MRQSFRAEKFPLGQKYTPFRPMELNRVKNKNTTNWKCTMDDNLNEFDKEFLGEHVGNCRRCGEDVDLGQALCDDCERDQHYDTL